MVGLKLPRSDAKSKTVLGPVWKLLDLVGWLVALCGLGYAANWAYEYRIHTIRREGPQIRGFDPWFNFRATQYLADRGLHAFFTWFDRMSWYPLGRPVATTIYPGMQIVAVFLWHVLDYFCTALSLEPTTSPRSSGGNYAYEEALGWPFWTLEEVCCYIPAWFGAASSVFIGFLAYEAFYCSRISLVVGAVIMAMLPAHLQRSNGGDFDNESVAITFMCATFWLWCRSLRTQQSWPLAAAAGVTYACMAASWGGYVLALNVIGIHACLLAVLGMLRCDDSCVIAAYSCFFLVGTFGATRVPVIAWTPFRSAEQLGPLVVFIAFQFISACRYVRHRFSVKVPNTLPEATFCAIIIAVGAVLVQSGSVAPFSARIRALFIASATRTGNPLVDSVSEHKPASAGAVWHNCHNAGYAALAGSVLLPIEAIANRPSPLPSPAGLFVLLFGLVCFFFSVRMSRLLCLLGPSCAVLSGVAAGVVVHVMMLSFRHLPHEFKTGAFKLSGYPSRALHITLCCALGYYFMPSWTDFMSHCHRNARWTRTESQKVFKRGSRERTDSNREGYLWLRENTPQDARVMAWWDYGYQITGEGNRTTLADGNTWNQEQIALIGLCLSSSSESAHRIIRHLADYVLIKIGGKSDLRISTHFARISNSLHKDQCGEIDCDQFGFYTNGTPSPMMETSLIYKLVDKSEPKELFEEVFTNEVMRIVKVLNVSQESRHWSADPKNRLCDAPGSWYCPGQYPPLLLQLINPAGHGAPPEPSDSDEAVAFRAERNLHAEARQKALPAPNGQNLPPGSYRSSCKGCKVENSSSGRGDRLRCSHCRVQGAIPMESVVENLGACETTFDNIRGQIQCGPKPNARNIPKGRYAKSCRGCHLEAEDSKLSCTHCDTANGDRRPSEFVLARCPPPATLDNNNGFLSCVGASNANDIPSGDYQNSCSGCELQAPQLLRCTYCYRADRAQVEAFLSLDTCATGADIDNQNGELVCH